MAKKEQPREIVKLEKKSVGDVKIIQSEPIELDFPKSESKPNQDKGK